MTVEVAPFPNPLGTDLFKSNLRWSVVGSSDHGLLSAGGQVQPVQQLRRGPASLMETGFGLIFFMLHVHEFLAISKQQIII